MSTTWSNIHSCSFQVNSTIFNEILLVRIKIQLYQFPDFSSFPWGELGSSMAYYWLGGHTFLCPLLTSVASIMHIASFHCHNQKKPSGQFITQHSMLHPYGSTTRKVFHCASEIGESALRPVWVGMNCSIFYMLLLYILGNT